MRPKSIFGPFFSDFGRGPKSTFSQQPAPQKHYVHKTYIKHFWENQLLAHCIIFREAPDTFNFVRYVMRAIWSVRPKCSHRCVSLKESPLKPVLILKHATKRSTEQTSMRTKWFKHIAIQTVQEHLLNFHVIHCASRNYT